MNGTKKELEWNGQMSEGSSGMQMSLFQSHSKMECQMHCHCFHCQSRPGIGPKLSKVSLPQVAPCSPVPPPPPTGRRQMCKRSQTRHACNVFSQMPMPVIGISFFRATSPQPPPLGAFSAVSFSGSQSAMFPAVTRWKVDLVWGSPPVLLGRNICWKHT